MLQALIPAVIGIIDKIIPDPQAAAAAKLQALELAQRGDLAQLDAQLKMALAQTQVNQADAAGQSAMQRNWRPAVGWVCAAALAWDSILRPMLAFGFAVAGHPIGVLPELSSDTLYGLLFGLLGLGGLRTVEKVKGAA